MKNIQETRELLKQYKNGNKLWKVTGACDRCEGTGYFTIGVCNGQPVLSPRDGGVCWKCNGSGIATYTEKELSPENQAKADAKAKANAEWYAQQELKAEIARCHEEALKENRIFDLRKAEADASNWQGSIGQRITIRATLSISLVIEGGMYGDTWIHILKDANGNVYKWKTNGPIGFEIDSITWKQIEEHNKEEFTIKGTVKEHAEYKGVKQTVLTRCKVSQ